MGTSYAYYINYFAQEYYVLTLLFIFSYGVVHDFFVQHYNARFSRFIVPGDDLWTWERNILGTFVTYAAVKVCLAFMAGLLDLRVLYLYAIGFYDKLVNFTPQNFKETVLDAESDVTWLVALIATWSTDCAHTSPVLARLSNRFTTEKLRFGKVDVGAWPLVAKAYGVDVGPISNQLPTLLLFEKGALHSRHPPVEIALTPSKRNNIKQAEIIKLFELDRRFAGSMGASAAAPASTPASSKKNR